MNILHKVTLKSLKKNRTRTLVTIIGILLSAAMFTAVTTSISSLKEYLIQSTIYNNGNWYGAGYGLFAKAKDELCADSRTVQSAAMELLGFSPLKDSINESKPYLCVYGIQNDFTDMMPIHLTQGRMPQNSSGTKLSNQETRTYHVVGFYQRPSFEDYQAPGYTALTIGDGSPLHSYDLYLRTDTGADTASVLEQMFGKVRADSWTLNYDLLRFYGYSGESAYNQVLYSLGAILIGIIMFGSISLIYNAFSISVSERTRQFGLLASIGATRHQLTGSVLFEALFLSVIGIPLGILSGLLGIGVTFFFVRDMMASVFGFSTSSSYVMARISAALGPAREVSLRLHPSLSALAVAVIVSLLTVIISAYLPARRAMKKSPIDAIRQTDDISIRSKKVKTSRLTRKLFGFEGTIATKNYKRSRKKYRATVISLFLSIVLFISASSLCAYLTSSMESVINDRDYDIGYYLDREEDYPVETLMRELSDTQGVTDSTYAVRQYLTSFVKTSDLNPRLLDFQKKCAEEWAEGYREYDTTDLDVLVIFLEDDLFRTYLKDQNLQEDTFFNHEAPVAVAMDSLRLYQDSEKKYYRFPAFKDALHTDLTISLTRQKEGYDYGGAYRNDQGQPVRSFYEKGSDEELEIPRETACLSIPLTIGAVTKEAPDFFPEDYECIRLFYPYSLMDDVFSSMEPDVSYYEIPDAPLSETCNTELYFQCENHETAATSMTNLLVEKNLPIYALSDYAASMESERAMITVINVFAFGFITLISLIAAASA